MKKKNQQSPENRDYYWLTLTSAFKSLHIIFLQHIKECDTGQYKQGYYQPGIHVKHLADGNVTVVGQLANGNKYLLVSQAENNASGQES